MPAPNPTQPLMVLLLLAALHGCQCNDSGLRGAAARIQVSPNPIVMSGAVVGRTTAVTVRVSNLSGFTALKLPSPPTITMNDAARSLVFSVEHVLTEDCTGRSRTGEVTSIAVGGCATLQLLYAPVSLGDDGAVIHFASNDPKQPVLDVPIQAGAATVGVQVCVEEEGVERCNEPGLPLSVAFPEAVAIGTAGSRSFKLRSLGTAGVDIDWMGLTDGDFTTTPATENFAALTLEPASEWPFTAAITRHASGERQASLQFTTSDPMSPVLVVNFVAPSGPALCWCVGSDTLPCTRATSATFGNVKLLASGARYIDLISCGDTPLVFLDAATPTDAPVALANDADAFTAGGLPVPGFSVDPGGAVVRIPLTFQPMEARPYLGHLTVHTNAESGTIPIAGNGVLAGCSLSATAAVNFGQVQLGVPRDRPFLLYNNGSESCVFPQTSSVTTGAGAKFTLSPLPLTPLAPGMSVLGTVTYDPQDLTGPDIGEITVFYRGESEPTTTRAHLISVGLRGAPAALGACQLRPSPSASGGIDFGLQPPGVAAALEASLLNTGTIPCEVHDPRVAETVTGAGGPFSFNGIRNELMVQPGASVYFKLGFTAPSQGSFGLPDGSVSLAAETDDVTTFDGAGCTTPAATGAPGCVAWSLRGRGRPPEAPASPIVVPPTIDFGAVPIGCRSAPHTITVTGRGQAVAQILSSAMTPPTGVVQFVIEPPLAPPVDVLPGMPITMTVRYVPDDTTADTATFAMSSDAPRSNSNPDMAVTFFGHDGPRHRTDSFEQVEPHGADVLFILDDSGSMSEEQSRLGVNVPAFMHIADTLHADYHVGVVTTDLSDPRKSGKLQGAPPFLTPMEDAVGILTTRGVVGISGSGQEQGLGAMYSALTEPLVSDPLTNAGFLRPEAILVAIVVSDEPDQSPQGAMFYRDFLNELKGSPDLVSFNAIVGAAPSGCSSIYGSAAAGFGYLELAALTGGHARSICEENWGTIAYDIPGLGFATPRSAFRLTGEPTLVTLQVRVDGTLLGSSDYIYDSSLNSVIFEEANRPALGAHVVVDYDVPCF